ncbi:MAG: DNA-binding protein WhiA [Lachnospiraceae bacterium]|nr:DNA-binding protein WhiA [Lachnospiraceae bacterium]
MSFSHRVKEELYTHIGQARHCMLSELSALIDYSGSIDSLTVLSENEMFVRKCFTLLEKTFNITGYVCDETGKSGRKHCLLSPENTDEFNRVRTALKGETLTERACCKRAYLRGAFLAAGSVNAPEKSYHLEIAVGDDAKALLLTELFRTFDISAKITDRKNSRIVYIKDGEQIAAALNVMEAGLSFMDYENVRIYKDVKNTVNRRVNCETANIGKAVSAALKQSEAIRYAVKLPEYESLPDTVKEVAMLRLRFPEVSLKELGEMCDPRIGKSGVNHRLRKIMELAEEHYSKRTEYMRLL